MEIHEAASAAEQSWTVDLFKPEDAAGVVGLYRAIYGESFPLPEVYRADWHLEQAQNNDSLRVVARLPDGPFIGTGALFRSVKTNPQLYEVGGLMVLQDYRKQNVAAQLLHYIYHRLRKLYDVGQIWGEAVCSHLLSQQLTFKYGHIASALEIDVMSEEVGKKLSDTGSRVSALIVFQAFKPDSRTVYLPLAYEDSLKKLYAPFHFGHHFRRPETSMENRLATSAAINMSHPGLARISVSQIGVDLGAWLDRTHDALIDSGSWARQVILPLDTPFIDTATEELRNRGYWFGGLLPRWFGHDGLLMQKTLHKPDFSKVKVVSKQGEEVLALVQADYEKQQLA